MLAFLADYSTCCFCFKASLDSSLRRLHTQAKLQSCLIICLADSSEIFRLSLNVFCKSLLNLQGFTNCCMHVCLKIV